MTSLSPASIAVLLDHAILQPFATHEAMRSELESLRAYTLGSVCIKPSAVPLAVEVMSGTLTPVGTVIGFPHGTSHTEVKVRETELAFAEGAREVDMVVNTGEVLSGHWDAVRADIEAVLKLARQHGGLLKVIFETGFLHDEEPKLRLCQVCSELGVDFVKTSTGFGFVKVPDGHFASTGAQDSDLQLMRAHCAPQVGVKASGGMRSLDDVLRVLPLGVSRIGTTSTHAILSQARQRFENQGPSEVAVSGADY